MTLMPGALGFWMADGYPVYYGCRGNYTCLAMTNQIPSALPIKESPLTRAVIEKPENWKNHLRNPPQTVSTFMNESKLNACATTAASSIATSLLLLVEWGAIGAMFFSCVFCALSVLP